MNERAGHRTGRDRVGIVKSFCNGQRTTDNGRRERKAGNRQMAAGRNKNFEFRICRNAAGFTLVEVIIIIVIMSVFMAAIGIPLLTGIRDSDLPEIATVAHFLATEKIEELAGTDYSSLTIGVWPSEDPVGGTGFEDYSRQVEVENVDQDLNPSATDVGYRKITVTVSHSSKIPNGISVETLRTNF